MLFQFPSQVAAGIASGQYAQVISATGIPLSVARDMATGQIVGHAVGALNNSIPLNPLTVPIQLVSSAGNAYQMHRGFQAVQASLGVLQATTAVIGVGVAAGVALSAVNLYQIIKLRKAVERLEVKVENGFLDLKQALRDQCQDITDKIDEIAKDVKFEQHRVILVRAYGLFLQALDRLSSAMRIENPERRNAEIDAARGMLFSALADYKNQELLNEVNCAGKLRRYECSWLIEQAIIGTYQAQNEIGTANHRLAQLISSIRSDSVTALEACSSSEELDFLAPEILRIHDQDLALVNSWQAHLEWQASLSLSEYKLLNSASGIDSTLTSDGQHNRSKIESIEAAIPEIEVYEALQDSSIASSIRDQLIFMMKPELRLDHENYVVNQAKQHGFKFLNRANANQINHFTLANLYWYFKMRDLEEANDD